MLRQHGMRRRYYHDEIGWNTRMDGFQGAILSVKLKYIDGWNQLAARWPARYHALFPRRRTGRGRALSRHGVVLPHEVPGSRHVWHQYVIRTPRRDALREFLASARSARRSTTPSRCTCRKR
jgi:dTDP-4-amino-4,6-dideoxygalactose transaminase